MACSSARTPLRGYAKCNHSLWRGFGHVEPQVRELAPWDLSRYCPGWKLYWTELIW